MREIAKKYLKEFDELEKKACNEKKEFINGYSGKIENIYSEKRQDLFNELENISFKSRVPKHENMLRKFELMYFLLDETGYDYAKQMSSNITGENKWKSEAKIRLFMMFVKRYYEAIYLLKDGLASSALDRVRGMYEIGVYLDIINKNSEGLAEKFLKHCNTSRLDLARSISDQEMIQKITEEINDFTDDYFYKKNNGWAKELFPSTTRNITFKNLVDITQLKQFYYMYKTACISAHATILDSIQGIELDEKSRGKSVWVTGASENGIEYVLEILFSFSCIIIMDGLDNRNLSGMFTLLCFSNIMKNK